MPRERERRENIPINLCKKERAVAFFILIPFDEVIRIFADDCLLFVEGAVIFVFDIDFRSTAIPKISGTTFFVFQNRG